MKNFVLVLLGLTILIGGGYLVYTKTVGSSFFQKSDLATEQRTNLDSQLNVIEIKNFAYTPKDITIKIGETVTWINKDSMAHDAQADDKSWNVDLMVQGESQTKKFDKAGTYNYHCGPHPWMKGTIVVK